MSIEHESYPIETLPFEIAYPKFPEEVLWEEAPLDREAPPLPDSVSLYLQEIGKIPLLSREKEIELAIKARAGNETAKNELIKANLRLVFSIAKKYIYISDIELLDLIQEGNKGLIHAAGLYDWEKAKFSTYASIWIRQSITRHLLQNNIIYTPVHIGESRRKLELTKRTFKENFAREPTDEELIEETKMSPSKIKQLQNIPTVTSSDTQVPGSEVYELFPSAEDPVDVQVEDKMSRQQNIKNVRNILIKACEQGLISEQEADILLLSQESSLTYLAKKYKLTKQRISQISQKAFTKIQLFFQEQGKQLEDFL